MSYDFTTLRSRLQDGSSKWMAAQKLYPALDCDTLPLSVADMEFPTAPKIVAGLKQLLDESVLGYTQPTQRYRQAVADWMLRRHNFTVAPEDITVTPGVVPAIYNAVKCFTQPGQGVIVMSPVYFPFYRAVAQNQRYLVNCPLLCDEQLHYTIDFDRFEQLAADSQNAMLILCNPHNPVGRVWTEEELTRIGQICQVHDLVVVSDEIHADLIMPGNRHRPLASLSPDFAQRCITCTAPTKTFNLAGLEVSNSIISNPQYRARFQLGLEQNGVTSVNIMGLRGCEIAYNQCEDWLEELLQVIDGNRRLAEEFLAKYLPEVRTAPLQGTYLLWMDLRSWKMTDCELEAFMQQKAHLFLDEGYIFGQGGCGFERVNLAAPAKTIRGALERLYKAKKEL